MDDFAPSLLNRLSDPEIPDHRCYYTFAQAESAVLRDLEDLLNTKRPAEGLFAGLACVDASVANFGLRDVTHINGDSMDERIRYAEHVKSVIETFEPRLAQIEVQVRSPGDVQAELAHGFKQGAIYFRVRATLNLDPTPVEGVIFDTVLHLSSGQHDVRRPGEAS